MKICVSYGHTNVPGGADYGVVNIQAESPCVREIAPTVTKYLKEQGVDVVEARIDKASSVTSSMSYRVNIANNANVDLFIEIHLNSGGGHGVETLICSRGGKAEKYAKTIVDSIAELGYTNRGVRVDKEYLGYTLYVLRNTNAPAIIIECGFTDSREDVNRYNADKIARKIVKGITGIEGGIAKVEDKINFDAVAMNQCNIELTDANGTGMLDPLELCEIIAVEPGTYQRTVKYQGWDRIKTGKVITGDVLLLKDAYNYYNAGKDTIKGYKDAKLTEEEGCIYTNEKVCVGEIKDGIAYLRFDSATEGPLRHIGYCNASDLCKIGEELSKEDTSKEEHLYKVQVGSFTNKENAEKLVKELKEKGMDAYIVE